MKSVSLVSQDEIKNTLVAERKHLKHTHCMVGQNSPGCSLAELIVLDKSRGNMFLLRFPASRYLGLHKVS